MSWSIRIDDVPVRKTCECSECGHKHERDHSETLFSANYTSNCSPMLRLAGKYEETFARSYAAGIKARELIGPLSVAVGKMRAEPEKYRALNPPNGCGSYETFVPWLDRVLRACLDYPDGDVWIST